MTQQKVYLRAIEPEDLDMLYKIENNRELWSISNTNVPYSRFALHDYVERCTNDIYTDKQVRMMIENEQHDTVGIIDLINFSPRNRRAEVGIVIMKPHRRKGYASAALDELVAYARSILNINQLYLVTAANNSACQQLFKSKGFNKAALLPHWFAADGGFEDACVMQLFI